VVKTDVLVIGGGIAGTVAAWHLARAGAGVILAEAGELNAQASGTNAGSLHLQIPHPEFVGLGGGWARGFAPTLRLLQASLEMWSGIETELGQPLDVRRTGGIVVATTDAEMRAIAAKAAVEAAEGVETELLDRAALLAEAPYLTARAIGGGLCRAEGKANPLRATPAFAAAAVAAGATILTHAPVTGLQRDAAGFLARTPRGDIAAGRVVNAAGARAAAVAAMLGVRVELQGFPLQVTVTEPVAPLVPHLVYSAAGKLSLKQAPNGGLIIGGGWPARQRPEGGLVTDPASLTGNMATAAGVVPAVAGAQVVRSWTATVNGTADWRPVIGTAPGVPGFILALFPWMGFSAGPMTGRLAADLALDRPPAMDLRGISVLAG
jgi:glycine/D-amino acid oxidase-like deaminating enzyme